MPLGDASRAIVGDVTVPASVDEVWDAWTTEDGIKSFFAPDCNVELRVDGPYEIFFDPQAAPGQRGGEGMRILALQPKRMLSFTWNAPPHMPNVRRQRTHVMLTFTGDGFGRTRLTLRHDGWGEGKEWDEAFAYFERAWLQIVLPNLMSRFEKQT
jgi:uncharacterized protein YndB with AHSA1/START domain